MTTKMILGTTLGLLVAASAWAQSPARQDNVTQADLARVQGQIERLPAAQRTEAQELVYWAQMTVNDGRPTDAAVAYNRLVGLLHGNGLGGDMATIEPK